MKNHRKLSFYVILSWLLLTYPTFITIYIISCKSPSYFALLSYSYKSSAGTDVVYPGSRNVQLVVEVRYNGSENIVGVYGRIILPPGFSVSRGAQSAAPPYNPNGSTYDVISPGDIIVFKYNIDISKEVNPGTYSIEIEIGYRYANSLVFESEEVTGISIVISQYPELELQVIDSYWSPGAYPGSEGVTLNIIIENKGDSDITEGYIVFNFPEIIDPRKVEMNIGALGKGSRATVSISDLSIAPDANYRKSYSVTANVDAIARTDDGVVYDAETTINFYIKVSSPPSIRLVLLDYKLETPYIADNIKTGIIHVILQNKDTVVINSITAVFKIRKGGRFVGDDSFSIVSLRGEYRYGDYIDVRSDQVLFNPNSNSIDVELTLSIFGSKDGAEFWSSLSYTLYIVPNTRFSSSKGLILIDAEWQNHYPVYPDTENATFIVTLANKWPYRISGITLKLELPEGFYSNKPKDRNRATAYIAGPIESSGVLSANFMISVKNVTPGVYEAKLSVKYIVHCDTTRISQEEEYSINIRIHSLEKSIELITATWYGSSPEPGTYGAPLFIAIRDNYVPQMRGTLLEIYLPKGFTCSLNNESYAKVIPYSVGQTPAIQLQRTPESRELAMLARYIASYSPPMQALSQGEIVTFIIPINIEINNTGMYKAKGILNFIDHWNNIRRINFTIPLGVLGSIRILEVKMPKSMTFSNGETRLNLTLINRGSAPIYETYVILIPQSPLALPVQNYKYLGTIEAHKNKTVSFILRYNPTSIMSMGGGMAIQYSSLPLMISVIYKDILGYRRALNFTGAVIVEPFVDIRLSSDTRATLSEGTLVVSGTVINYGITQARSVEVKALLNETSSSMFIGDLDPASQAAFRVEILLDNITSIDKVRVDITYRDNYDRVMVKTYMLGVTTLEITRPSQQIQQPPPLSLALDRLIIIIMVAVFLTFVSIIIYKAFRRQSQG